MSNYELSKAFAAAVNSNSRENYANIPDYIIGDFLVECLMALENAVKARDSYYGIAPEPGYPNKLADTSGRTKRIRTDRA